MVVVVLFQSPLMTPSDQFVDDPEEFITMHLCQVYITYIRTAIIIDAQQATVKLNS